MAIRARSPSSFDVSISDCTFRAPTHTRLFHWRRIGLATFHPYRGAAFDGVDNKDASLFATLVPDPLGRPAIALVHRPLFPGTRPEEKSFHSALDSQDIDRECIWISYSRVGAKDDGHRLNEFVAHHNLPDSRLGAPQDWRRRAPVMCRHGWLFIYHGVHNMAASTPTGFKLCYSAGAMVLSREHPNKIIYRSQEPILAQEGPPECHRTVDDVVFPAALIDATISALPSASTCIMAWRIIGSALRVSRRLRRYPGASKC